MQKIHLIAFNPATGAARGSANIRVLLAGTATLANLFQDDELTPKTNPFLADINGRAEFKANNGKYDVEISGTGFATFTYTSVQVSDSGVPVGTIVAYAGSVLPAGWLLCDGQLFLRTSFPALFNVIGASYGGSSPLGTFNVPNLLGRFPFGGPNISGNGTTGGSSTMAAHAHESPVGATPQNAFSVLLGMSDVWPGGVGPTLRTLGRAGVGGVADSLFGTSSVNETLMTMPAGGGSIMPPYVTVNYIIKT